MVWNHTRIQQHWKMWDVSSFNNLWIHKCIDDGISNTIRFVGTVITTSSMSWKWLAMIGGLWSPNTKTYENIICLNTIALRVLIYLYMQLYIPLLIFSISFVIFKISSIRIDFLSTLFTIYSWFFKALFVNFTCLFA